MTDSLGLTTQQWNELDELGRVVEGWSDALLDNMTAVYDLEGDVINEMVRIHKAHEGSKEENV